jgi:hypothetical protein
LEVGEDVEEDGHLEDLDVRLDLFEVGVEEDGVYGDLGGLLVEEDDVEGELGDAEDVELPGELVGLEGLLEALDEEGGLCGGEALVL